MKKAKRIFALIGVILLLGLYAATFILALIGSPSTRGLFMGAIFCTIAVPIILYAMSLMAKNLRDTGEKLKQHDEETKQKD